MWFLCLLRFIHIYDPAISEHKMHLGLFVFTEALPGDTDSSTLRHKPFISFFQVVE